MKRSAIFAVVFFLTSSAVFAAKDLGLGIIIGEPTGISFKYWTENTRALDGGLAWSFSGNDRFHIHGDYLFHSMSAFEIDAMMFDVYYGAGLRILFDDDTKVGIRVPLGAAWASRKSPLDIFFEIVPIMDVMPDTRLDINAGIGVRYYF